MVDHTMQEVVDAAAAEDSRVDSLIAYNDALKKQVTDALSGASLPPNVQTAINGIFDRANANATRIDTALNTDSSGQPLPAFQPSANG